MGRELYARGINMDPLRSTIPNTVAKAPMIPARPMIADISCTTDCLCVSCVERKSCDALRCTVRETLAAEGTSCVSLPITVVEIEGGPLKIRVPQAALVSPTEEELSCNISITGLTVHVIPERSSPGAAVALIAMSCATPRASTVASPTAMF